jgi:hypothetical protein
MAILAVSLDMVIEATTAVGWLREGRLALIVGLAAVSFDPVRELATLRMTNVDVVARTLEAACDKDDFIVVAPWFYGVSFSRYYHGAAPWMTLPNIHDHNFHRYDLVKLKMQSEEPIRDVCDRIRDHLKAGKRVWVTTEVPVTNAGYAPVALPPAPHAPSGWREIPYLINWWKQMAYLIGTNARQTTLVTIPKEGHVIRYEELWVTKVEGWRAE